MEQLGQPALPGGTGGSPLLVGHAGGPVVAWLRGAWGERGAKRMGMGGRWEGHDEGRGEG